ncbi:hypothetical protein EG329_008036 [Mollisiaceae sp. DMI_Dod_QoI]|nr:hypothetical protein EG329_008036 [Helotiales sp. DMI_Dod_QoI]
MVESQNIARLHATPPIPNRSLKRNHNLKLPAQGRSTTPMSAFHYNPKDDPPASQMIRKATEPAEDPFAEAFARRRMSFATMTTKTTTRQDSVFDRSSARSMRLANVDTPFTPSTPVLPASLQKDAYNNLAFEQPCTNRGSIPEFSDPFAVEEDDEREEVTQPNASVEQSSRRTSQEPFPDFYHPFADVGDEVVRSNATPDQIQSFGQKLVSQLKRATTFLIDLDQNFEIWSWEQGYKRLEKKRIADARRESLARTKALDREHKAQIKLHKEKEMARNKRAKQHLKEQKRERKEQSKRRDQAAKRKPKPLLFVPRWQVRMCDYAVYGPRNRNGWQEQSRLAGDNQSTITEPSSARQSQAAIVDPYSGVRETYREVVVDSDDESWFSNDTAENSVENYPHLRRGEEDNATRYR